jgi:hypothetical protein
VENAPLGPPPVVTITPTIPPVVRAGVIQVIEVLFTTLRDVALNPPNVTDVAPVKFVPVIVTLVPPTLDTDNGKMLLMLGGKI